MPRETKRTTYEAAWAQADYEVGANIQATDDDTVHGDKIHYNISQHYYLGRDTGDADAACFATEAFRITEWGQLMIVRDLDGCTHFKNGVAELNYTLLVQATDSQGLSDSGNVTIQVVDANTKPQLDDVSVEIAEDLSVGSTVTTFVGTDADDDTLTYSLQVTKLAHDTRFRIPVE